MRRTEVRIVALDVVCALTEKLRRMGLTRGENSGAGMGHSEEVASDGSQPYMPNEGVQFGLIRSETGVVAELSAAQRVGGV